MRIPFRRYSAGARWYDLLSGERLVYRIGRVVGIRRLGLRPGDTVLDVGCGTGLNLPMLVRRVGPGGLVIGADLSPQMLRMAQQRVDAAGWRNVVLLQADATTVDWHAAIDAAREHTPVDPPDTAANHGHARPVSVDAAHRHPSAEPSGPPAERGTTRSVSIDAAVATYSLSVTGDPEAAWVRLRAALRSRARVCVVDMSDPVGLATVFLPLARLACALGGADITAHPWRWLEAEASSAGGAGGSGGRTTAEHLTARGGHIHIVTGTVNP